MKKYMKLELISYGLGDRFDINKFKPIENLDTHRKPYGGLWASPVSSEYGWREWCLDEDFHVHALEHSFKITYEGITVVIDSEEDLKDLLWKRNDRPDFRTMADVGVDAIYITKEGMYATRDTKLSDYSCESVIIMNPNSVKEVQHE